VATACYSFGWFVLLLTHEPSAKPFCFVLLGSVGTPWGACTRQTLFALCGLQSCCLSQPSRDVTAEGLSAVSFGRRAPDRPYNCDICYNATTRRKFWGFVSCIVKLADLSSGKDARLTQLTDMVSSLFTLISSRPLSNCSCWICPCPLSP
jgi:hypothetical protein